MLFKINKVTRGYSVTRGNSDNANYLVVKIKFELYFRHIMIDLDEIFLTIFLFILFKHIFIEFNYKVKNLYFI